MTALDFVFFYI